MEVPSEYLCPLCNQLLTKPIELRCGKYACAMCCCNKIRTSNSFTCPCCHKDHLSDYVDGIKAAPNILLVAIGNLSVTCTVCDQIGTTKSTFKVRARHTSLPPPILTRYWTSHLTHLLIQWSRKFNQLCSVVVFDGNPQNSDRRTSK